MKKIVLTLCALSCSATALANDPATYTHLQNVDPYGCPTKMGDVTVDMGNGATESSAVNALLISIPKSIWTRNSEKLPSAVGTRLYARSTSSDPFRALVVKSTPAAVTVAVSSNFFGSMFMDVYGISLQKNDTAQSAYTPSWSMTDGSGDEEADRLFRVKAAQFLKCVAIKEGENV